MAGCPLDTANDKAVHPGHDGWLEGTHTSVEAPDLSKVSVVGSSPLAQAHISAVIP